jgi:tetratricopeptide (TPR) repeat protein
MFVAFLLSLSLLPNLSLYASPAAQARNTIEGRVTTSDNRPLSEIRVFLRDEGYSQAGSTLTDGTGRFRFTNLRSGVYTIQVEPGASGYERQEQRLEAKAFNERRNGGGEVFRVEFVLLPKRSDKRTGGDPAPGSAGIVFHQDVPEGARKEYERGAKNLEKGAFESAAQSLKHAVDLFPDYYDALELLGTEYVKRHDYPAALPLLTHAVEINKDGWRAFYSLGIIQYESDQRGAGIKSFKRAVELNPNSPNANMRLGMALMQVPDALGEAIQTFERGISLAKDSIPQAYFYLGILYSKISRYREAADTLGTFLHLYPHAGEQEKIRKLIEECRQKAKAQGQKLT